jgi:hypothetical protein
MTLIAIGGVELILEIYLHRSVLAAHQHLPLEVTYYTANKLLQYEKILNNQLVFRNNSSFILFLPCCY